MFTTAKARSIALAAVAATAFLSLPAQADDPRVPRVVVSYADLDLTTDAGVEALYRRLQVATRQVCRVFEDHMIERSLKHRACYDQVLAESVAKVNVEMLSVLHRSASAHPRVS